MRNFKRLAIIIGSSLIILVVIIILFISPITKYLIEKYDEKYTGRQISLNWAYVNPFTGYLHLSNLKIHEAASDSIFFSSEGLSVNFSVRKLFSSNYEITQLTLNHPQGIVIQNKNDFNFNDLIKLFSGKELPDTNKSPVHFNVLKVKIIDGIFYYREQVIPINYYIKNVNIECTGYQWNVDTVALKFSFIPGIGTGDMKGEMMLNIKNMDYRFATVIHKFDLQIIAQYLKDLTNFGTFTAFLEADVKAKGNLNNQEDITASGMVTLNDFHFGKNPKEDYASFDKFLITIDELSPLKRKYLFDTLSLTHPYFKYERYDSLDNMETIFGKDGSNISASTSNSQKFNLVIEIANYIKALSRNFFRSSYTVNRLEVNKADIKYNDYSLGEKFSMDLNPLFIKADSINKNHRRVNINLKSGVKPYGDLSVALSINPKDSSDFDIEYDFQKLPVTMFNPYAISYTSFPLDRGTIELNGSWHVRNGNIKSENHLILLDPRLVKRIRNESTKWLPMRLIMAFVREGGNVIDYQIPITGNLNDPKFHVRDAIFDALKNIVIKPATTPYRMEVKNIETEIEKSLMLSWKMRQSSLENKQEKFVNKIAGFLKDNADANIIVFPMEYAIKEKEYILFFEAKKKYFLSNSSNGEKKLSDQDSATVEKMSVKDPMFIKYLNEHVNDSLLFTVEAKCLRLIDQSVLDNCYQNLMKARKQYFLSHFNQDLKNKIKIADAVSTVPFNGFSYYKIEYKGQLPKSLIKAYEKLNEIDNRAPRKKYKDDRRKIKIG